MLISDKSGALKKVLNGDFVFACNRIVKIKGGGLKTITFLLGASLVVVLAAFEEVQAKEVRLPLDLSSSEYELLLKTQAKYFKSFNADIEKILKVGKRNLDWLKKINETQNPKLSFWGPNFRTGFPLEEPKKYNQQTVVSEFSVKLRDLPEVMKQVLLSDSEIPSNMPLPKDQYLEWGRIIDKSYQNAARWKLMRQYLPALEQRRQQDIRGWYFLQRDPMALEKMRNYSKLPAKDQADLKEKLTSVCFNTRGDFKFCQSEFTTFARRNQLLMFFEMYKNNSQKIWDDYFVINPNQTLDSARLNSKGMSVSFKPTESLPMQEFLRSHLQSEWQWEGWKLSLVFEAVLGAVEVLWTPGATPHVPYLGSHQIVMDANTSIFEWEVQWTIKHEFGHNLGFPDCYNEFYEAETGLIVAYQMDLTDLMCSRKGNIKKRHIDELNRVYGGLY
jgi:hypothetical protein